MSHLPLSRKIPSSVDVTQGGRRLVAAAVVLLAFAAAAVTADLSPLTPGICRTNTTIPQRHVGQTGSFVAHPRNTQRFLSAGVTRRFLLLYCGNQYGGPAWLLSPSS